MKLLDHDLIREKIQRCLDGGDVLFIVPPFGSIHDITLGPHNLKAVSEAAGFKADILYLNLLLAYFIGMENYETISKGPLYWMLGERMFSRSAYGLPALGLNPQACADEAASISGCDRHVKMFVGPEPSFNLELNLEIEALCFQLIETVTPLLTALEYRIIGCAANLIAQTNCSMALFRRIKEHVPETVTVIGGCSCDGLMAQGITSLSADVDYVFSGESEESFKTFLEDFRSGNRPAEKIIQGVPVEDMDALPFPDYDVFFTQYRLLLEEDPMDRAKLWYETSRGCWWAQRPQKCLFCGIHVETYRQKSVEKTAAEIKKTGRAYPGKLVFIADNIMPTEYKKDLLPLLGEGSPGLAYQLRADLDLDQLVQCRKAGINVMLPGVESFSSGLLKLMKKGIAGRQNLLLLRHARCVGIFLDWNLIWGFPGDDLEGYEQLLDLLPLIQHLQPPHYFTPLVLMRFSPYIKEPERYGLSNVHHWDVFDMIYPQWADIAGTAVYFRADFQSLSRDNPQLIAAIADRVTLWKKTGHEKKVVMSPMMHHYLIYDNRDIHAQEQTYLLDRDRAREIMNAAVFSGSEHQVWALEKKLAVQLDGWYVPLVIAAPQLLLDFMQPQG